MLPGNIYLYGKIQRSYKYTGPCQRFRSSNLIWFDRIPGIRISTHTDLGLPVWEKSDRMMSGVFKLGENVTPLIEIEDVFCFKTLMITQVETRGSNSIGFFSAWIYSDNEFLVRIAFRNPTRNWLNLMNSDVFVLKDPTDRIVGTRETQRSDSDWIAWDMEIFTSRNPIKPDHRNLGGFPKFRQSPISCGKILLLAWASFRSKRHCIMLPRYNDTSIIIASFSHWKMSLFLLRSLSVMSTTDRGCSSHVSLGLANAWSSSEHILRSLLLPDEINKCRALDNQMASFLLWSFSLSSFPDRLFLIEYQTMN